MQAHNPREAYLESERPLKEYDPFPRKGSAPVPDIVLAAVEVGAGGPGMMTLPVMPSECRVEDEMCSRMRRNVPGFCKKYCTEGITWTQP